MPKKLLSVRVDQKTLGEVRRALGAKTDSEAVQRCLDNVVEEERERKFWRKWGGKGGPGAFEAITKEHVRRRAVRTA